MLQAWLILKLKQILILIPFQNTLQKNIEELCGQFENANYQTKRNETQNVIMTGLALGLTKSIHNH